MKVDFSKAPAWAIGHALHAFGGEIREVWVGEHQYQRLDQPKAFPYGGGNSDHRHNPRRSEFHFEQLRPAPWTGEGLPPVGTVCEMHRSDYVDVDWQRIEFLCAGSKKAFFRDGEGHEWSRPLGDLKFRPIRTPEQIAAEEHRAKYMPQLIQLWDADTAREAFLEAVYEMIASAQKQ